MEITGSGGGSSELEVGVTTIVGGANGLFLYDNNGVLGEVAGLTKSQADTYYAPISVTNYTLPTASASVLGGIKVGSGLSIDGSGVLSASGGSMVYPEAGIPVSTGSAWATSISGTSSQFVKADGSLDSNTYLTSLLGALLSDGTITGSTSQAQIFSAPTTGHASINLAPSSAVDVSSPNSGDMWWNGTNLYFYNGSTNKDLLAGGGGSSLWTETGTTLYPTNTIDNILLKNAVDTGAAQSIGNPDAMVMTATIAGGFFSNMVFLETTLTHNGKPVYEVAGAYLWFDNTDHGYGWVISLDIGSVSDLNVPYYNTSSFTDILGFYRNTPGNTYYATYDVTFYYGLNVATGILTNVLEMPQIATPIFLPLSNADKLYFKSDDRLYSIDHSGTEIKYSTLAVAGISGDIQTNNGSGGLGSIPQSTFLSSVGGSSGDIQTNNGSVLAGGLAHLETFNGYYQGLFFNNEGYVGIASNGYRALLFYADTYSPNEALRIEGNAYGFNPPHVIIGQSDDDGSGALFQVWGGNINIGNGGHINSDAGYYAGGTAPIADGTYTLSGTRGGSITFKGGIVTAFSQAE
jgi:hypothetical protein